MLAKVKLVDQRQEAAPKAWHVVTPHETKKTSPISLTLISKIEYDEDIGRRKDKKESRS